MINKQEHQISILGFNVSKLSVEEIVSGALASENLIVNCINPHSYIVQKKNKGFRNALLNSDFLIPDGSGIVFGAKLLQNITIEKVSGYDLFIETMGKLEESSGSVFMLGSSDSVLQEIVSRAAKEFPSVTLNILSPPFKEEFDKNDIDKFVKSIEMVSPDVVFVGLTAPKQEIVIDSMPAVKGVKFMAGIGAVFDFYSGASRRPHDLWIRLNLEWFRRFLKQPRHLWKRVFISMPLFIADIFSAKISSYLTTEDDVGK